MELHCPEAVLLLGGFLAILSFVSLIGIWPIMVREDENKRISFVLTLIGIALVAVSRL